MTPEHPVVISVPLAVLCCLPTVQTTAQLLSVTLSTHNPKCLTRTSGGLKCRNFFSVPDAFDSMFCCETVCRCVFTVLSCLNRLKVCSRGMKGI